MHRGVISGHKVGLGLVADASVVGAVCIARFLSLTRRHDFGSRQEGGQHFVCRYVSGSSKMMFRLLNSSVILDIRLGRDAWSLWLAG